MESLFILLYPFRGICWFFLHKQCWHIFMKHLLPLLLVAVTIYSITTLIYLCLMLLTGGWFGIVSSSAAQSAGFLISFIYKFFILPGPLSETFDLVVITELLQGGRKKKLPKGILGSELDGYYGETALGRGFRHTKTVFKPGWWLLRELIYFVIDMIPFIGPFLVVILRSAKGGFKKQKRYFYLKGLSHARTNYLWYHKRHLYFCFGVISLTLELIPFANILFFYTNTVGAALWAADVERARAVPKQAVPKQAPPS